MTHGRGRAFDRRATMARAHGAAKDRTFQLPPVLWLLLGLVATSALFSLGLYSMVQDSKLPIPGAHLHSGAAVLEEIPDREPVPHSYGGVPRSPEEACLLCRNNSNFKKIRNIGCCDVAAKIPHPPVPEVPLHVVQSLRRLRIVTLGDSVTDQIQDAWYMMMGTDLMHDRPVIHHNMPVIPHTQRGMEKVLQKAIERADVLIISVGMWYDYGPEYGAPIAEMADVDKDWTERQCEKCSIPFDPEHYYAYAADRSMCQRPQAREGLRSDVEKMAWNIIKLQSSQYKLPLIIWKSAPPKHFRDENDEMECQPAHWSIWRENPKNAVIKQALGQLTMWFPGFHRRPMVHFLDLWQEEVGWHRMHPPGRDCLHWCNPSYITFLWVARLARHIYDVINDEDDPRKYATFVADKGMAVINNTYEAVGADFLHPENERNLTTSEESKERQSWRWG